MSVRKIFDKVIVAVFITGALIMLIKSRNSYRNAYIVANNYTIVGVVDSVAYDIKGEANITVARKHFYLGPPFWSLNKLIFKGDSIIKDRNSMVIKLIKQNGRVILIN